MSTTTLSTKGQVLIPKEVRERRGWAAGLTLEVEECEDGVVLRPVRTLPRTTVDDLLGCLPPYKGRPRTLAQMEAGISKGARRSR
jgi:AbrB family looped-hinge helix DNA binding protein